MCKSDGALGGVPLLEVFRCRGLHLVVTEVVPIGGGADNNNKKQKQKSLCCSVFEWRTKNGLELSVACLSTMISAVKSWNFLGLICLLFAGRVFKKLFNWHGWDQPLNHLMKERKALLFTLVLQDGEA